MAKPASVPRWAETVGGAAAANIVEPNEGKKDIGYDTGGDIPTSGGLNWILRTLYSWVKWINAGTSAATASTVMERDASGRTKTADPAADTDVDTQGARNTSIGTHNAVTNPHSATSAATADRIMLRDAAGRAKVAAPAASDDIARLDSVDGTAGVLGASDGWTLPTANWIRKVGKVVTFYVERAATTGTHLPSNLGAFPAGFLPADYVQFLGHLYDASATANYVALFRIHAITGVLSIENYDTGVGPLAAIAGFTIATGDTVRVSGSFLIP